jgi:hypothetical protein
MSCQFATHSDVHLREAPLQKYREPCWEGCLFRLEKDLMKSYYHSGDLYQLLIDLSKMEKIQIQTLGTVSNVSLSFISLSMNPGEAKPT